MPWQQYYCSNGEKKLFLKDNNRTKGMITQRGDSWIAVIVPNYSKEHPSLRQAMSDVENKVNKQ